MFDISWQELMVIAAVAVVVIGPKDLPQVIRSVAGWVKKARELAGEFQRGVDEMVREAELNDIRQQVEKSVTSTVDQVKATVDPGGELEKAIQSPESVAQSILPPDLTAPPPELTEPPAIPQAATAEPAATPKAPASEVAVAPKGDAAATVASETRT
jgi:sec-independent protein translocase protein TatB